MRHKKKNRTRGTILKTQMMKKNLLLLSDCLKSPVKVQYSVINSKYFLTFITNKWKKSDVQNVAPDCLHIPMSQNEVIAGLEQKKLFSY
jgi:hypothetical protein